MNSYQGTVIRIKNCVIDRLIRIDKIVFKIGYFIGTEVLRIIFRKSFELRKSIEFVQAES